MATREEVIQQALRRLGAKTGDISSGTATTAVLGNMFYSAGEDDVYKGALLFMLDAANAGDKVRVLSEWDDSAAEAKWVTDRTDTTYTSENYILMPEPEFDLADIYNHLNDRLQQTRFSVESILPTKRYDRYYSLGPFTWIRNRKDVLGVFQRGSANLVDNAKFDVWLDGPSSAPTGWTLSGAGGTVARSTSNVQSGYYSAALTRAGADTDLAHTINIPITELQGESVTAEVYVVSGAASTAQISLSDDGGTTTTDSTQNSGTGLEKLTVTATFSATAVGPAQVIVSTVDSDTTANFSNVKAVSTSIGTDLDLAGSTEARLRPIPHEIRDVGGKPAIELRDKRGRNAQLVIYSKAPFPTLSADTDSTDCPDDVIVPGLVYELARRMQKSQDRERYDRLMLSAGREYGVAAGALIQAPVPSSQIQQVVRSA